MRKKMSVCLVALLVVGLGGCVKNKTLPADTVLSTNKEWDKTELSRNMYVGKYYMIEDNENELVSKQQLPEDGYTFKELGLDTSLLCLEIMDTKEVSICIKGRKKEKAQLINEDDKTYIKLEKALINNYGDKILLDKTNINGKNYLTFKSENDKRVYLEPIESKPDESKIQINSDGTFDAVGRFFIDREVVIKETGEVPDVYWGIGFSKYGTSMNINEDKTGKYIIGVADFNEFRIVHDDGKTYMEIMNDEDDRTFSEGVRYLMEIREINDKQYIYVNKEIGQYWKQLDKGTIVFNIPGNGYYYWDSIHLGSDHM